MAPITAPLVTISTMYDLHDRYGILIDAHRPTPIPCDANSGGQAITENGDFQCFYADPVPNSWVQVLALTRNSLSPLANKDVSCPAATQHPQEADFVKVPGDGVACSKALSDLIGGLDQNDMVVVSNQPGTTATQPPVGVDAVLGSVGSNHGIGADPTWYNSPDHGAHLPATVRATFSAVGVPGWKPKSAISLASNPSGPMGAGAMQADVTVNNLGQYQPTNYTAVLAQTDPKTVPLAKIMFQRATPWPDVAQGCDNAAPQSTRAAISAVGTAVSLGPDPRSQYYSQPVDFNWSDIVQKLHTTDYVKTDQYSSCEFTWAKSELEKEIHDVVAATDYTSKLADPITETKGQLWATFTDVLAHLNDSLSSNTDVQDTVLEVLGAILTLTSLAPSSVLPLAISVAASIVIGGYKVAGFLVGEFGGRPDMSFSTAASRLAVQTTQTLTQQENEMRVRWRNILVADYGKMSAVAACVAGQSSCPDNSDAWHIGNVDQIELLSDVLRAGIERNMYETLFPKKYPWLVNIFTSGHRGWWMPWGTPQQEAEHPKNFCTLAQAFPDGTGTYLLLKGNKDNDYKGSAVYVATNDPPGLDKFTSASSGTFDRMFGKVTGASNWTHGGLGIDEPAFFQKAYFDTHQDISHFELKWPGHAFIWGCASSV